MISYESRAMISGFAKPLGFIAGRLMDVAVLGEFERAGVVDEGCWTTEPDVLKWALRVGQELKFLTRFFLF